MFYFLPVYMNISVCFRNNHNTYHYVYIQFSPHELLQALSISLKLDEFEQQITGYLYPLVFSSYRN